jgi:hypothetical protein
MQLAQQILLQIEDSPILHQGVADVDREGEFGNQLVYVVNPELGQRELVDEE